MIDLRKGDCLEVMKSIPNASIDAIITDPPYGTTQCKWDSVIDFELMWEQLNRIIKPNGAIVLFGSEPFSSALRMSNIKNYKYDWIWDKVTSANFIQFKNVPAKCYENICVFYKKKPTYNPQMEVKEKKNLRPISNKKISNREIFKMASGEEKRGANYSEKLKYPRAIQVFNRMSKECNTLNRQHPTQKPIALMEYLIKTYTQEKETVLDFTMGSGSTGVACQNTNRNFIGIEQDDNYFKIAQDRIKENEYKLF